MTESNLSFAKIVANPNVYSWAQAYNAGKLFAVLSLETQEESEEKDYLNVLGKEILDSLEQEFFTLETKDLESIKNAVLLTSEKIPQEISCSFVIGAFIDNVLYVYILGDGKLSLKREGKLGHLLEANDQENKAIKVASGFLQDGDVLILQTKQFSKVISTDTLFEMLDGLSPKDAAENIAPLLHEKDESGASSIIINYKKPVEELVPADEKDLHFSIEDDKTEETEEIEEKVEEKKPFYSSTINQQVGLISKLKSFTNLLPHPKLTSNLGLNHPKKVLLTIVVIIIVVFVGSVFFALKKQGDTRIKTAFESIYPPATKKYNEGQGLIGLNQNLANDSFTKAKEILENGKSSFPKNSSQEKQVLNLLAKVNTALNSTSQVAKIPQKQIDLSLSPLLLAETKNSALYYFEDDKNIYGLTANNIFTLKKDGSNQKTLIKNDSDWQSAGGLALYFGNVYVLDKKQNQILKFVQTDSGFSKTNYLADSSSVDFSKASAMTIDSSVYVLFSNGTIIKFTKGKKDNFTLNNLSKNLSNPTRIYSNIDFDNVYILDNGNSRIVVLDKSGNYKAEYQASFIKNASDFEVFEKDKKVYVLSSGKLYEINLK